MTKNDNQYNINLNDLTPEKKEFFLKYFLDNKPLPAPSPNELVLKFHETYGLSVKSTPELNIPEKNLRFELIKEEFEEYAEALENDDFVEVADALADLIYVIYGAAISHGVNLDNVLEEVQRSNMSKLGEDGQPIRRADGKILKGPNFSEPDIATVLTNQGWNK